MSKNMYTLSGNQLHILSESIENLEKTLRKNRKITPENEEIFFSPTIEHLHDPFLLPDMEKAVKRILEARERQERIVIFGDYDVDGVSSTAILVRFLADIGCLISYRLPHRVHDGYGLKSYFFDELATKDVKLVITVDCGTRDIEPIRHAHSLGIDVIVTDHHAVPDTIPGEVIAIINPKRQDSEYPFRDLAGAGVAFKLLHAIIITLERWQPWNDEREQSESECVDPSRTFGTFPSRKVHLVLNEYIDFASLWTVSDCMPMIGENRTIVTLGLAQMNQSRSHGLRTFLEWREKLRKNDADIIGFQIGPRINAAGRMDTPLTALQWLLAGEGRTDAFFSELEHLNETRKWTTEYHLEKALQNVDTSQSILIYDAHDLEHGIIGLVAGKLTEMYNKPAIVLKNGHDHPLTSRKWDTTSVDSLHTPTNQESLSIASCRSPEWCSIIELLESCREYFIRFWGHRQAAGFTIETDKLDAFRQAINTNFAAIHDVGDLPKKTIEVECRLDATSELTLENVVIIDRFRPFGIGNRKPLFLLEDETILEASPLGKEGKHLQLRIASTPSIKFLLWSPSEEFKSSLQPWNIVSLIIELDRNEWNGKESVSVVVKDIIV